jgi:hypothetical protein
MLATNKTVRFLMRRQMAEGSSPKLFAGEACAKRVGDPDLGGLICPLQIVAR